MAVNAHVGAQQKTSWKAPYNTWLASKGCNSGWHVAIKGTLHLWGSKCRVREYFQKKNNPWLWHPNRRPHVRSATGRKKEKRYEKNIVYNIIDNACLEELFLIGGNNSLLVKIYYMVLFFHYLLLSERSLWFIYWRTRISMATSAGMKIHSIRPAWQTVTETKSACRCGNTHGLLFLLFFHYIPCSTQPSPNIDLIFTQRKQFLDVPKGHVMPQATADNLAANSLKKQVFPMKSKSFAFSPRILKFTFFQLI